MVQDKPRGSPIAIKIDSNILTKPSTPRNSATFHRNFERIFLFLRGRPTSRQRQHPGSMGKHCGVRKDLCNKTHNQVPQINRGKQNTLVGPSRDASVRRENS